MKTPESIEKDAIKDYLRSIGAYFVITTLVGYGKSGNSDILACIDGRFWSIEVKREGKEPTEIQAARVNEVQAAGGMATWGTAEKVIGEIEQWRSQR